MEGGLFHRDLPDDVRLGVEPQDDGYARADLLAGLALARDDQVEVERERRAVLQGDGPQRDQGHHPSPPSAALTKRSGTIVRPRSASDGTSSRTMRSLMRASRLPRRRTTVMDSRAAVTVCVVGSKTTVAPRRSKIPRSGTRTRPSICTGGTSRARTVPSTSTVICPGPATAGGPPVAAAATSTAMRRARKALIRSLAPPLRTSGRGGPPGLDSAARGRPLPPGGPAVAAGGAPAVRGSGLASRPDHPAGRCGHRASPRPGAAPPRAGRAPPQRRSG